MDDWQNELENPSVRWIERLWRRGEQPGVVRLAQGRDTVSRLMRWGSPSLADEVARRYGAVMALQQQMPPIVYAEPVPVASNNTAVSTIRDIPPSPLPVVKPRPQTTPPPSHTPLVPSAPLPVVNVPDIAQTRSAAPRPQPSSLPRPATPLSASGSPASKASMSPVVTRPPAAAPQPQPVHPIDVAATRPLTTASPTNRPVESSSLPLPIVQPQLPAASPPRPATPPVVKTPALPNSVETASTTPINSVPITAHIAAAARPQLPVHPPAVTPLTREKQGAAASHSVSTPSSTPVVTPSVTLSVSQLSRDEKPLPVVREQFAIPSLATPTGLNQPLPLAQPAMPTLGGAGTVVQRQPHKSASRETTMSQRPSPTPNRLVRTTPVVQRAPLERGATISPPINKESTQSEDVSDAAPEIDMDELVEKVHRHFLRRLTIEGERRGKTSWP